jgi:hypothetical protein
MGQAERTLEANYRPAMLLVLAVRDNVIATTSRLGSLCDAIRVEDLLSHPVKRHPEQSVGWDERKSVKVLPPSLRHADR